MHFTHRPLTRPAAESPADFTPLAGARFSLAFRLRRLFRWAAVSALLFALVVSFAAQFVLFDVTFTFTKEDADNSKPSQSHYYVKGAALNPERPRDWTAPIDYRRGTVHLRTEVLEKPAGGEPTT